jgi:hypothetical protein
MTKIASVTVGASGTSSFDFTSIPQTYTDLVVKISTRSTYTSGSANTIQLSLNGSTASFTGKSLEGESTTVTSGSAARSIGATPSATATSSTFSNGELYFPNYTSSNYKAFSYDVVMESNASSGVYNTLGAGLWSNTAAITSITISTNVTTWAQYTTATLYGVTKYAETGTGSKATGGTVTTSGGYTYHTFYTSGMFTPTTSITGAEVLLVAGGGGADSHQGGGGGAGGVLGFGSQSFSTAQSVIIGAGGIGGSDFASNGTNSTFGSLTATVGGGAGGLNYLSGSNGGSGGGGASKNSVTPNYGTGTSGQGNRGGNGTYPSGSGWYSGGGGGAGAVGGDAVDDGGETGYGGSGGAGTNSVTNITSLTTMLSATATGVGGYIAGGGGGGVNGGTYGAGGLGGGGAGSASTGVAGVANTGSGAGGGGNGGSGSNGGSGIVIVRYTT